jgi:ketosteroid isomerase-like protein
MNNHPGDTAEIAAREDALYRAMIERDFQTLRSLLSDDVWYVHSTGVAESKEAYLAAVANGRYDYERIASRNVTIRVHAETAVTTGEVEMSVSAAGEPKRLIQLLFTLLWVRQAGRWQLLVRQATRMPSR